LMFQTDFFILFLLAHLTGDYVLQTDRIARMKAEGVTGVLVHISIISVVQISLLSLFGINGILAGAIAGVIHFFIDYAKAFITRVLKNQFGYYIVDQSIHIAVMLVLTFIFGRESSLARNYIAYFKNVTGVIILTFFATVTVKLLLRDLYRNIKEAAFFEKYERLLDILAAVILCALFFLPALWGIVLIAALFYPYQFFQKRFFKYRIDVSAIKYLFYALTACILTAFGVITPVF